VADRTRSSNWAGGDFQQPPRSDGGVALCGACRSSGRCRLGLTAESLDADGVAHFDLSCPPDGEGGPGVAHGGWTAGVLDEVLGHVPILHDQLSVTHTLTVRFRRPVPVGKPLHARAWIDRIDGERWHIAGELTLASSGAVLATGHGVWVARRFDEHFERFRQWLAAQEEGGG
jgi:acyl-coenzyme A thioesterase PaaI-like protein